MIENMVTRQYFNRVAPEWETKKMAEEAEIQYLLSQLDWKHGSTILDVGCGTGLLFPYLERMTQRQAKIFAMDFAEFMIYKAAQKYFSSIKVLCGCARYLPFRDNSIDQIIAFHVFPHIKGKNLTLLEWWRVLRPNGELAILHSHSSEEINTIHNEIGGAVKGHYLPPASQMACLLNKAGFYVKTAIDRSGEYYVGGVKTQ